MRAHLKSSHVTLFPLDISFIVSHGFDHVTKAINWNIYKTFCTKGSRSFRLCWSNQCRESCTSLPFRNSLPMRCQIINYTPSESISLAVQKWRPFWIFEFRQKCKNASTSLTVRDRAISSKFSTNRVLKHYTLPN